MMSSIFHGALVFLAATLIDIFYALWFRFSNNGWEHKAAIMSVLCGAAGLFGAWMVIAESPWFIIPDLVGLYVGTIVGLRFSKSLERRWGMGGASKVRVLSPKEIENLRALLDKKT